MYHYSGRHNEHLRNEEMSVSRLEERKEGRWSEWHRHNGRKHLVKLHGRDTPETIGRRERKAGKDRDGGCEMSQQGKTVTLCPILWNIRSPRADNRNEMYPYVSAARWTRGLWRAMQFLNAKEYFAKRKNKGCYDFWCWIILLGTKFCKVNAGSIVNF